MSTIKLIIKKPIIEEIRIDQDPKGSIWKFIPLYKLTAASGLLFWQIGFNGVNHLEINSGYVEGVIYPDYIEIQSDKSLFEARRLYKMKYLEGYAPAGALEQTMVKGMKGNEYIPDKTRITWPVYTQPKLDGIRMLCHLNENGTVCTKSFNDNVWTHLKYLEHELKDFFMYLPKNAMLDGEMYNHDMSFSTIISAVKTLKTVHPRLHEIQYLIFDINFDDSNGTPFEKRYELLKNAYDKYVIDNGKQAKNFLIVPCQVAHNHDEVVKQHNEHYNAGYEGIMLKKISHGENINDALYIPGKRNNILKYKYFQDEEVIITNILPNDSVMVQDKKANRFEVSCKNFQTPKLILGNEITIRYQELLNNGIPKNPKIKAIRNYE